MKKNKALKKIYWNIKIKNNYWGILIIIFLLLIIILWTLVLYYTKNNTSNKGNSKVILNAEEKKINTLNLKPENDDIKTKEINNKNTIKYKIEKIKKKLALKWLIQKWDYYFDNSEYTIALSTYLKIYKDIPNDESVINKIWDIYFNLEKFNQAFNYYSKNKNHKKINKHKAIESLFFMNTKKLSKENITSIKNEIISFNLNDEEYFYYINSLDCIVDFSLCKEKFQNYFLDFEKNNTESTWSIDSKWEENIKIISFDKLINIKNALENYENFKLDDISYKNALISGAFFLNWLYPVAIETSKIILEEKPDYKPMLKIIAKSYFELWLYKESKWYLIIYNNIDNYDSEISYFLWIVYEKLHEYVLSSIHLKNSIERGYVNSIDSRRRIIYNYYEVGENIKMLDAFDQMILEEKDKITIDDISLAIYYNIINNKLEKAKELNKYLIETYDNKELYYWYLWWIQIEENIDWSLELAEKNLNLWLEINENNPMINYIFWMFNLKTWDTKKAFIHFKKTIFLDKNWEFWLLSQEELDKLNIKDSEKWV